MIHRISQIVSHRIFDAAVLVLIVVGALLVGLETSRSIMESYGGLIRGLDRVVVGLFAIEAALKIASHGRRWYRYFLDPWNVLDFAIVAVCLLPIHSHQAAVLRLVRVFRALRLISAMPKLQLLVHSLLKSLPSMVHVGMLLAILFFIYAVLGVFLWRENDPVHFRNLGVSLLTLFRVITLEDWTDIMYIQMKGSIGYAFTERELAIIETDPHYASQARPVIGAIYFVTFVMIGTMIMLNLVIGVIINSMNEATAEARRAPRRTLSDTPACASARLDQLEARLREAQELLTQWRQDQSRG